MELQEKYNGKVLGIGPMHGHEHPFRMFKELSVPKKDQDDNLLKALKSIAGKNKIKDFPIVNPFTNLQ
jgi:hypothetical protein